MQAYWSRTARDIVPYTAGEQPQDDVLIKLNTNENAYPPSPEVASAVTGAMRRLRLYPPPDGRPLREALARHTGLPYDHTYVGNGSDEVLALAFRAFFDEDAPVAWPAVTYSFYPVYARLFGLTAQSIPMADGLRADLSALLAHGGPVVLANPNAPTGIALPISDIGVLAAALERKGHILLLDEAYAAFSGGSAACILPDHPNLLIVGTLSKSHALAGMRIGYALGHPDLLEALWRIKDSFNSYPLDHLALAAGAAALDDAAYFAQTRGAIIAAREAFAEDLGRLGFETLPSGANFVFTRHPGFSGATLMAALRHRGILVRRFASPEIADYLRVTIGTEHQMTRVTAALGDTVSS